MTPLPAGRSALRFCPVLPLGPGRPGPGERLGAHIGATVGATVGAIAGATVGARNAEPPRGLPPARPDIRRAPRSPAR